MYANRPVIHHFTVLNLQGYGKFPVLFTVLFLFAFVVTGRSFPYNKDADHNPSKDTIFIRSGCYYLSDSLWLDIPRDTFCITPNERVKRDDSSGYLQSKIFYDTVYKKLSRKKFTKLLYPLAFHEPKLSNLPDSAQVLKSTSPFEEERGKVIQNILIKVLSPFGTAVYDTGKITQTGAGKALNSLHRNTRQFVIRRNLLFKKGDRLDPATLADNERILRDINAIDNARIIVAPTGPDCDTVDVEVLVKDVWSIGLDIPVVTARKLGFRIYDANFLGLSDQFITKMSTDIYRSPFFRLDGFSYIYSNIGGSFINATLDYTTNDLEMHNITIRLERTFITNHTKWAGGAFVTWKKDVNVLTETSLITSYGYNEGIWLGRAFLPKGENKTSRFVIAAGLFGNNFSVRPYVSIDSNRNYYNNIKLLTTFSVSKNIYYLTDYVLEFGKTENLPYGHLIQITTGVDKTDFYSRIYTGINLSAGNYFNRFGYISAYAKFGGFFDHSSFEDAVVKFYLGYFTPLLKTPDQRFKFRTFFSTDYRYTFNERVNNRDYFDANLVFNISKVNDLDDFRVVKFFSVRTTTVCFTPWYLYGFRFAFTADFRAGLVAQNGAPLVKALLFTGVGLGFIIKNDNLVFPALIISGYFYPSTAEDIRPYQVVTNSNLNAAFNNFNVGAPYEETIGN